MVSNPSTAPSTTESAVPEVNTKAIIIKAMILFIIAVVGVILYKTTPLKVWFDKAGPVAHWFSGLGAKGIILFGVSSVVLVLLGVPRLLLCPLAGALYGFAGGLTISIVTTMISYYLGFIWVRGRRHKGLASTILPKQLAFLAGDPGFTGVVISRCVPLPGMLVTMALALSNVSDFAYLTGSAFGLIFEAVPMVLLGAMDKDLSKWGKTAALSMLFMFAAWLLLRHLIKRYGKKKSC